MNSEKIAASSSATTSSDGHPAVGFVLIILLAGMAFSIIALVHIAVTSKPPVTIDDVSGSLALTGQPGQHVAFALSGDSVSANWATDGITLSLDHGTTAQAAKPRADTWGHSIDCGTNDTGCSTSGFTVPAEFTIPLQASPGDVLHGTLTGDITYPAEGSGGFSDADDTVYAAVTIRVMTAAEAAKAAPAPARTLGLGGLSWLAILGASLLLFVLVAVLLTVHEGKAR